MLKDAYKHLTSSLIFTFQRVILIYFKCSYAHRAIDRTYTNLYSLRFPAGEKFPANGQVTNNNRPQVRYSYDVST